MADSLEKAMSARIENLELSIRTYNCLKREECVYVGDILSHEPSYLRMMPNYGKKSHRELTDVLSSMGLCFGLDVSYWKNHIRPTLQESPDCRQPAHLGKSGGQSEPDQGL